MEKNYEVLIVGGGPAGLTAAMTLGRLSRTALLCDDGKPRNYSSTHVNNFPSRDGIHPEEWRKATRSDLAKYKTIETIAATVVSVEHAGSHFVAQLSNAETIRALKLILAYGVVDTLPAIPGFKELWGKSIFHCPFCHGFEVRGKRLGLFTNHPMAFHALPMIFDLASELTLFTNGRAVYSEAQKEILKRRKIELVDTKVVSLQHREGVLENVVLEDGRRLPLPHLFYFPNEPFRMKSQIGALLGCEKNDFGFYKTDGRGATNVPGVFACGDCMSMAHSVLLASASGVTAGSSVVWELLNAKLME